MRDRIVTLQKEIIESKTNRTKEKHEREATFLESLELKPWQGSYGGTSERAGDAVSIEPLERERRRVDREKGTCVGGGAQRAPIRPSLERITKSEEK